MKYTRRDFDRLHGNVYSIDWYLIGVLVVIAVACIMYGVL